MPRKQQQQEDRPTKFIFVTGGVASALGKGLAAASTGALLEAAGLRGDESVLDVGTGAGHTAFAFAAQTARVEALALTVHLGAQVGPDP